MIDHTRTEKIDDDSIFMFVVIQVVAGNRYDSNEWIYIAFHVKVLDNGPRYS